MARDFLQSRFDLGLVLGDWYSSDFLGIPRVSSAVVETSLTTSALSRDTISVQAAGAGSQKLRAGGGGRGAIASARVVGVHASTLNNSYSIKDGGAHQTSLRS